MECVSILHGVFLLYAIRPGIQRLLSIFFLIQFFQEFLQLLRLFLAVFQLSLISEDTLDAIEEIIAHRVILCLVAETAAGLKIIQIIGTALGQGNDMIHGILLKRNETTTDSTVTFGTVVDCVAFLGGEESSAGSSGGQRFAASATTSVACAFL